MDKRTKKKIILAAALLLLAGCANQLPPSGGDVDRIPPEIVEVYPEDGTTNYDEDYFEIEFSEYVNKRSFKDALFISPFVEGKLDYSWTGTTVTVEFEDGLKENTTYTVTVGTDVVDRNNSNRMVSAFTFTFSTGNQIDKNAISGRVYSNDREGVLIFAYKLDEDADSLLNRKPDYVSQTGNDGTFQLSGLASADYRLFAVKDQFRDLIYDLDQDKIGVPSGDIHLSGNDTLVTGVNFKLFQPDTSAPRLMKGILTDERHLLLTVSEQPDPSVITPDNFYLIDSTENKKYSITYAFNKLNKKDEIVLVTGSAPPVDNVVYLFANVLKDTIGNKIFNDYVSIIVSDKPDTTAPLIGKTLPPNNSTAIDFENAVFKFYFDDAFVKDDIQRNITFSDTLGKGVPFKIDFENDAALVVKPLKKLKPDKDYIIKIDFSAFKDMDGNSVDSVYEYKFKTISGLDFTGVEGTMLDLDFNKNPVLVLENTEKQNLIYKLPLSEEKFSFGRIEAGKYSLWCFYDENKNNRYDYGWPQPIKFSERFSVYSDTLKLKERWTVTDVIFQFK